MTIKYNGGRTVLIEIDRSPRSAPPHARTSAEIVSDKGKPRQGSGGASVLRAVSYE
jgi:hypothetical protein